MRLIDADALIKKIKQREVGFMQSELNPPLVVCQVFERTKADICGLLDDAPTIDAVPVVRCGECINGKPLDNGDVIKCMMIGHNNPPYSYCWWGERREG